MPFTEQKLEMLLVGGVVFQVDSLFKKGNYWEKNLPWLDPQKIICLNCVYHFGASNGHWKCDSSAAVALSVHLRNPGPSTVRGTLQALNKCILNN